MQFLGAIGRRSRQVLQVARGDDGHRPIQSGLLARLGPQGQAGGTRMTKDLVDVAAEVGMAVALGRTGGIVADGILQKGSQRHGLVRAGGIVDAEDEGSQRHRGKTGIKRGKGRKGG